MFEFTVMHFGVTDGPGTWYIDDILVFADDEEEHDQRVNAIKETLAEFQIKINHEKAIYKAQTIKFLGMIIHPDRVEADPTELQQCTTLRAIIPAFLSTFATYNVDPAKPLVLYTDASQIALGAILYQEGRPVQITSR
ncbi:reverse transcriptase [Penicillium cf. viridicatum]|uniref:Reverse transcriptase n=1 Tax=Penicillium cf. viridicatum TaxID=2972119 RepID=A0A9W9JIW3_9EURO|nr:reverse transcriptase [Penicillium cf. viridicatum]